MNIENAFQDVRRIYLDTPPLIYLVDRNPVYFARMLGIVDAIERAQIQALTSVVALTEILVQPLRLGNVRSCARVP